MPALTVRSEVLEYGGSPVSPWLAGVETLSHIKTLLVELLQHCAFDESGRSFVTPQAIATALDINAVQARVLVDLLAAVAEPPDLVQRADGGEEVLGVEVYCLALYLFVHFYLREAHKADASDVWPPDHFSWQMEPSSPMRMTAHSWGKEQPAGHSHKAYLPSMRQHLQQHLAHQEALLSGFAGFVARHADVLVGLATAPASPSPGKAPQPRGLVSAAELDRLAFLLRPHTPDEGEGSETPAGAGGGGGSSGGRRKRRAPEGGSPMDVCPTPFGGEGGGIAEHTPFFGGDAPGALAPADAVAAWLADTLRPADDGTDLMVTSEGGGGGSPPAPSPQRTPVFNQLAAQLGVLGPQPAACDVHGVHKATVARGEDDFPGGRVRVVDCHDAVVYALAPLQYAAITACSDCVVVLGAVGRALRVERCERVQVIAACRCVAVNTCHDCILYLGANQPPLLLGDNRFLQLAPYNSGYERLAAHMGVAGVAPAPNLWDQPLALLPDHSRHGSGGGEGPPPGSPMQQWQAAAAAREAGAPASPAAGGGGGDAMELSAAAAPPPGSPGAGRPLGEDGLPASPVAGAPPAVTVLPPGKLMPFVVPFRGGPGPMCGGPASLSLGIRASSDSLSNFMAVGEGAAGNFPASPFRLPPAYAAAWEAKMRGAAEVRAAVKAAELEEGRKKELMGAIQAHFKDWLQATGSMRQVYDLARSERQQEQGEQEHAA